MIVKYETRQDMIAALELAGTVAEIGVFRGEFAADILRLCPKVTSLTLVDIWLGHTISGDQNGNNEASYDGVENMRVVQDLFKSEPRVKMVRGWSHDYFATLADNCLDVVYVDGDHSYEGCKRDLLEAYRVVKPDGWIMGHDYLITEKCEHDYHFGVKRAVDELCKETGLSIHSIAYDGCASFAIRR
jgi:predicted O-methyltransferase YrrM